MDNLQKFETIAKTLHRCGYTVLQFATSEDAKKYLNGICVGKRVGIGSSVTLNSMGFPECLINTAKELYLHEKGEYGQSEHSALTAELYLTSANAISKDGNIVNIDGTGNRVGATIFGPERVIYVVGKNKIVATLTDALNRAKSTAVKMASLLNLKTPCATTKKCTNCYSPDCICAVTSIHRRKPNGIEISILLIDEKLGL